MNESTATYDADRNGFPAVTGICRQFGIDDIQSCHPLGNGLINSSYRVQAKDGQLYFLQRINTSIFKNPLALQTNYEQIETYLSLHRLMVLPALIKTIQGELAYTLGNEVWRCFAFVAGTHSPLTVDTPEQAYNVANCFGRFTASLHRFDSGCLDTVIPNFHDLSYRYGEFQTALQNAPGERTSEVQHLINQVEKYKYLVALFQEIKADEKAYPLHVMHHDCKVSNILFDEKTGAVLCPVDLDTTQPGLFFSDIGDMIRTMAPDKSENEPDVDSLLVRPDFLKAIIQGYTDAMQGYFTKEENEKLFLSGLILTYMQAMRFLTDYLHGNVYYKTEYAEQNKDRAANQLRVLQLLSEQGNNTVIK